MSFLRTALALGLSLACSSRETPGEPSLEVAIVEESGETPPSYRVIAHATDGSVSATSCPSEAPQGALACTPEGVTLRGAQAFDEIFVKSRGSASRRYPLSREETERGSARIELTALPAFESTASYRTGMSGEDAEEQFLELAMVDEGELGPVHSLKFYIRDLRGTPEVYFQNTRRPPLHYDFARLVLGIALSREQFAARTYQGEDRTALAGTLLYHPDLEFTSRAFGRKVSAPLRLEFFPSDDLSPELALTAQRLLEERLGFVALEGGTRRLFYVPAGSEQERALATETARFRREDALHAEHVELYSGVERQLLNPGLAYGTLRRLEPEALATEIVSFRDILVLPRLPIDLPLVAGTITEELQTPLAHVNLAARARGTPNLALLRASEDARVLPFFDKLVRFEVTDSGFSIAEASLEEAEAHWQASSREPLTPVADGEFVGLPRFSELYFEDSVRVGAKAANLAELRRLLGEDAPDGFAVPFSAYEHYMTANRVTPWLCADAQSDCTEEGRTVELCEGARARCDESAESEGSFFEFAERLLDDAELATDTPLREASVDALRYLVKHGEVDAEFARELDARVQEVFGDIQVRLRSSTNAEDLPGFSGAGLYESVSAEGDGGRRPSRRIRDVWASVWLWRAFEERQYWNIDSRAVRMAVALNPAIDDEAANGVLITKNLTSPGSPGYYVNVQLGEIEVTNPEGGETPEVFTIVPAPGAGVQVVRERFSSLSPEGALLSKEEIQKLSDAADRVQARFATLYGIASNRLALDLEFKFHGPDRRLLIKQARPYAID